MISTILKTSALAAALLAAGAAHALPFNFLNGAPDPAPPPSPPPFNTLNAPAVATYILAVPADLVGRTGHARYREHW